MFQWQNFKSNRKKDKTNKRVIKFASELNWNMPSLPRRDFLDVEKQSKQGHWTASASHLFM